jgi:hypothetical protein
LKSWPRINALAVTKTWEHDEHIQSMWWSGSSAGEPLIEPGSLGLASIIDILAKMINFHSEWRAIKAMQI